MRTLRKYSAIKVKTTDGRYRHMILKTVTSQTNVAGRVGLPSTNKSVSATRKSSTTTRGVEFTQ